MANQPSSAATGPSCDGGKGFDLDIKSKLGELADETPGSRLGGAVIEVIGAEILVPSAVPEHVVDRGQHRSGTQRLLGATAAAQAIELGLEIAALLAGCGPGALDEHGLEPRGAFAQAGGPALARALVIARTKPGPGQQMGRARKAAHITPDLRQNHPRRQGADARNGDQQADHGLNRGLTGFDRRVHPGDHRVDLPIDPLGGRRQGIDLPKVKPQQETMVIRHPPPQRLAQLIARRLEPPIGKLGQDARIGLTGASIIARPLTPRMSVITQSSLMLASSSVFWTRLLANQLLAEQRAQFLDLRLRNETRPDQANRSAIQVASLTSVLRPGTFLM